MYSRVLSGENLEPVRGIPVIEPKLCPVSALATTDGARPRRDAMSSAGVDRDLSRMISRTVETEIARLCSWPIVPSGKARIIGVAAYQLDGL